MQGGKAGRLVRGYRGAAAADAAALVSLLHRLSRLAVDLPEVAELDLNPVIATTDGLRRGRRARPPAGPAGQPLAEELVTAGIPQAKRGEHPMSRRLSTPRLQEIE